MKNKVEQEKRNSSDQPLEHASSHSNKDKVLGDINKSAVLNTGQVYINGENSIWIVDHHYFGSSCAGRVYFVAQIESGDVFRSVGNDCTQCHGSMPQLDISIPKGELERKIEEDAFRERKLHELRSQISEAT